MDDKRIESIVGDVVRSLGGGASEPGARPGWKRFDDDTSPARKYEAYLKPSTAGPGAGAGSKPHGVFPSI